MAIGICFFLIMTVIISHFVFGLATVIISVTSQKFLTLSICRKRCDAQCGSTQRRNTAI